MLKYTISCVCRQWSLEFIEFNCLTWDQTGGSDHPKHWGLHLCVTFLKLTADQTAGEDSECFTEVKPCVIGSFASLSLAYVVMWLIPAWRSMLSRPHTPASPRPSLFSYELAAIKNCNSPPACATVVLSSSTSTGSTPPSFFFPSVPGGQNKMRKCNNHCLVTVFSAMFLERYEYFLTCYNKRL